MPQASCLLGPAFQKVLPTWLSFQAAPLTGQLSLPCLTSLTQPGLPCHPLPVLLSILYITSQATKGACQKKTTFFGNLSQHRGGVRPNPKTFVNPPSHFWHATEWSDKGFLSFWTKDPFYTGTLHRWFYRGRFLSASQSAVLLKLTDRPDEKSEADKEANEEDKLKHDFS